MSNGRLADVGTAEQKAVKQVENHSDLLTAAISALGGQLEKLAVRLEPVLHCEAKGEEGSAETSPTLCSHANYLREQTTRVHNLSGAVNCLLRDLQL